MDKCKLLLVGVLAMLVGGCVQMGASPEEETEKNASDNGSGRFAAN